MGNIFWQTVFSKDGCNIISHLTRSLPCTNVSPRKKWGLHCIPLNLGFYLLWKWCYVTSDTNLKQWYSFPLVPLEYLPLGPSSHVVRKPRHPDTAALWWHAASWTQLSSLLTANINHQIGEGMSLQPWFLHPVIKSPPFLDSSTSGCKYSLRCSQYIGKEIGKRLETRGRTVQTFSYSFLIWVLCYWGKGQQKPTWVPLLFLCPPIYLCLFFYTSYLSSP